MQLLRDFDARKWEAVWRQSIYGEREEEEKKQRKEKISKSKNNQKHFSLYISLFLFFH